MRLYAQQIVLMLKLADLRFVSPLHFNDKVREVAQAVDHQQDDEDEEDKSGEHVNLLF